MNLVVRLKQLNEIKYLSQLGIDVFCFDTRYTAKKINEFDIEAIKLAKKQVSELNKKIYVLINKMIHELDLVDLENYLNDLKKIKIDGIIINDLTVYVIAKKLRMENLIIYQPGTFNTDTYSKNYFSNKNILGITLSRELTLEEIKKISEEISTLDLSLIIHGYLDMFYSKRKLISRYLEYKKITGKKLVNNYDLRLNEEIRPNDYYPILEDEFGTHIFRSKKLISIDEITDLKQTINTFFIERIFMSDQEYFDAVKLYTNKLNKSEFLDKYKDYDSGFYYRRTEKVKGESNEN
ncbi:peptidase U32 family protein [Candidatus Izemoplasma sp. B36]|uniref:peptidase U32 family protein n=1 Tax=Candidatus Izemoplasma sp. B36 TaxID=3242468 RepID=UPI0035587EC1